MINLFKLSGMHWVKFYWNYIKGTVCVSAPPMPHVRLTAVKFHVNFTQKIFYWLKHRIGPYDYDIYIWFYGYIGVYFSPKEVNYTVYFFPLKIKGEKKLNKKHF